MLNHIKNIIKSWKEGVFKNNYQTNKNLELEMENFVDDYLKQIDENLHDGIVNSSKPVTNSFPSSF